jgi:uncharacterized protein YlxW (UPF0749 family)
MTNHAPFADTLHSLNKNLQERVIQLEKSIDDNYSFNLIAQSAKAELKKTTKEMKILLGMNDVKNSLDINS